MIVGYFMPSNDAVVRLGVRDATGTIQEIPAAIDTGFDGYLTLPTATIQRLGLALAGQRPVVMIDGTSATFNVFTAEVLWGGRTWQIEVEEVPEFPAIGRSPSDRISAPNSFHAGAARSN